MPNMRAALAHFGGRGIHSFCRLCRKASRSVRHDSDIPRDEGGPGKRLIAVPGSDLSGPLSGFSIRCGTSGWSLPGRRRQLGLKRSTGAVTGPCSRATGIHLLQRRKVASSELREPVPSNLAQFLATIGDALLDSDCCTYLPAGAVKQLLKSSRLH